MTRIVELQLSDAAPRLTVRDRELLLEVIDSAIDETLLAASVFDRDTEIRRGYNERINTLLALFQKIMGTTDSETSIEALPSPGT